jgi:hypothetical protein
MAILVQVFQAQTNFATINSNHSLITRKQLHQARGSAIKRPKISHRLTHESLEEMYSQPFVRFDCRACYRREMISVELLILIGTHCQVRELILDRCEHLMQHLPTIVAHFPALTMLSVRDCDKLTPDTMAKVVVRLSQYALEELYLGGCINLQPFSKLDSDVGWFVALKRLDISDCVSINEATHSKINAAIRGSGIGKHYYTTNTMASGSGSIISNNNNNNNSNSSIGATCNTLSSGSNSYDAQSYPQATRGSGMSRSTSAVTAAATAVPAISAVQDTTGNSAGKRTRTQRNKRGKGANARSGTVDSASSTLALVTRNKNKRTTTPILAPLQSVDEFVLNLCFECDRLEQLDLSNMSNLSANMLVQLIGHATQLQWLSLAGCTLTIDSVLQRFGRGSPLKYIHLGDCTGISEVGVIALARACRQLRHIDLSCCSHAVTENSIRELCSLPLETLRLRACTQLNTQAVQLLFYDMSCPDLRDLDLSYCDNLTSATTANILFHHTKLHKLNLSNMALGEQIPKTLQSQRLGLLRKLCLKSYRQCTEADMIAMLRGCTQLESLSIVPTQRGHELTDAVVACVGPNIRKLCIEYSTITDVGLQHLASTCHKLVYLNLSHSNCLGMAESEAPDWPRGCPTIQYLSLENCNYIDSAGMQRLACLKHLRYLNVAHCKLFNDLALDTVSKSFPWLEYFVFGCNKISEVGKQLLYNQRPELIMVEQKFGQSNRTMGHANYRDASILLKNRSDTQRWKAGTDRKLFADHRC